MKILVTGGAGFIGSHIAEALLNQGHIVHIIDNFFSGFRHNVPAKAHLFEMDISNPAVINHLQNEKYEVIYHQAAQMDVRKSVAEPTFDTQMNIIGSIHLLEGAVKSGVKKFIFASSGGAGYGEQEYFPADEKHPMFPLSPYGINKCTVEKYLFYYQQVFGLQYVSLRYANVYGSRQSPHGEAGVIAIFADRMIQGKQSFINGDGLQTRDFVYVSDVVDANMRALNFAESGCFNVGTGIETNVVQLFQAINAFFGNKTEEKHNPAKAGEQLRSVLSHKLITEKMGWKPTVLLKEGLPLTLEWFVNKQKQS